MNISIFGLGYVGSVSLACLSKNGHTIIGVDTNDTKVNFINEGKSPIIEYQLDEIIAEQHSEGNISATSDVIRAVKETDVSFICVGTPSTTQGHLNLDTIFRVSQNIAEGIKEKNSFHVVAIRSTVLPGTNDKVSSIIEDLTGKKRNEQFAVISNPEFLREGSAINDYFNPSYTLLGSSSDKATEILKKVYEKINAPIITTEIEVAEILKYVNNTFHALKITFANEIGNICKKLNIDSHKLMDIFSQDTKLNISPYYLKPGFAYGGSCLPKDLKALSTIAHDHYLKCPIIENIEVSNENHVNIVLNKIIEFNKRSIGFLGLSFKAGTDDLRSSPIVDILEKLLGKGFDIKIFDRNVHLSQLVGANKEFILQKIPYISDFISDNPEEIIDQSEVIVVVNREDEFQKLLSKIPQDKIVFDLININFEGKSGLINYVGVAW